MSYISYFCLVIRRRRDIKIPLYLCLSVNPCDCRTEKLNIVTKDLGRTQNCDFSVLDQKYSFWANLVQKSKRSI